MANFAGLSLQLERCGSVRASAGQLVVEGTGPVRAPGRPANRRIARAGATIQAAPDLPTSAKVLRSKPTARSSRTTPRARTDH